MILTIGDLLKLHNNRKKDLLFWWITEDDIQAIAQKKIGRELNSAEVLDVSKGIDSGLGSCWTDIVESAIDSAT